MSLDQICRRNEQYHLPVDEIHRLNFDSYTVSELLELLEYKDYDDDNVKMRYPGKDTFAYKWMTKHLDRHLDEYWRTPQ